MILFQNTLITYHHSIDQCSKPDTHICHHYISLHCGICLQYLPHRSEGQVMAGLVKRIERYYSLELFNANVDSMKAITNSVQKLIFNHFV